MKPELSFDERLLVLKLEANLLEKRIKLEALVSEREAFLSENADRIRHGYAAPYGPHRFHEIAAKLEELIEGRYGRR